MEWSTSDVLGVATTIGSVSAAIALFVHKFGQTTNEIKNLGMRVDKLEKKVDEILFFLSRKFKKHNWKR